MDKLFIHNLKVKALIGLLGWEKRRRQKLILNIEIFSDFSSAIKTDNINSTIDYSKVEKNILNFVKESHFNLIETFAAKLADLIIEKHPVKKVKIEVIKPSALIHGEFAGFVYEKE